MHLLDDTDPIISCADVAGLYLPRKAAAASGWTATVGEEEVGSDD